MSQESGSSFRQISCQTSCCQITLHQNLIGFDWPCHEQILMLLSHTTLLLFKCANIQVEEEEVEAAN